MTQPTARRALYDALMTDGIAGRGHSPDRSEKATALIDEVLAEYLPPWEAMYDSATFTPRLLAYCNDEVAAKGAAEAWLRSQVEDAAGLEWTPDPQMAVGEWSQWLGLTRTDPEDGMVLATDIVVRRRTARSAQTPQES